MSLKLFHFTAVLEQLSMCSMSSRELEHPNSHRGSVDELDRQMKCHRTGSVTDLDEIE